MINESLNSEILEVIRLTNGGVPEPDAIGLVAQQFKVTPSAISTELDNRRSWRKEKKSKVLAY